MTGSTTERKVTNPAYCVSTAVSDFALMLSCVYSKKSNITYRNTLLNQITSHDGKDLQCYHVNDKSLSTDVQFFMPDT